MADVLGREKAKVEPVEASSSETETGDKGEQFWIEELSGSESDWLLQAHLTLGSTCDPNCSACSTLTICTQGELLEPTQTTTELEGN